MYESILNTPVNKIRGVGDKRAKLFGKLGIFTALDLLRHFPRTYEDLSRISFISELHQNDFVVIRARVTMPVTERFVRKGMIIYTTAAADDTGVIKLTIFNRKYAAQALKVGEEHLFRGKVDYDRGTLCMNSPEIIPVNKENSLKPVYSLTEGLTNNIISAAVESVLKTLPEHIDDTVPPQIRREYGLAPVEFCYRAIHFPTGYNEVETARKRFIFEELFFFQLGIQQMKSQIRSKTGYRMNPADISDFISSMPFELTEDQNRAVSEITSDMCGSVPMQRLLQGDVGSGKTAVAAAAMYFAYKNGHQSVLMAPTEVLAAQHYRTFTGFFKNFGIKTELLCGSTPAAKKKAIKERLANGEINMLIGTHAVITDDVTFKSLALTITDEQHRFGVQQRAALANKSTEPHVLIMSATPIPRTLALIMFGDLDISTLNGFPKGRGKIDTYHVNSSYHDRIYTFIKKNIDSGRQAYLVCPLVEENEELDAVSAKQYYEKLKSTVFKGYSLGLLYGKMPAKEKDAVMKEFSDGNISLLISTTVIEVGVDVPNANIMAIENAERYGLSQLHQLRGRIGRGQWDSHCILISDTESSSERLDFLAANRDGFRIAEKDLELRGPGDMIGKRQHGLPEFEIADLGRDLTVFYDTLAAAKKIYEEDPDLEKKENSNLKKWIDRMFTKTI